MDVLLQQRNLAKSGNHLWTSLVHTTHSLANGALKEVKEGTSVAVSSVEHALEQPISALKGFGSEIKTTIVEAKNTMVHLAILGMFGYFAWEFVTTERVVERTGNWISNLGQTKRQRLYY